MMRILSVKEFSEKLDIKPVDLNKVPKNGNISDIRNGLVEGDIYSDPDIRKTVELIGADILNEFDSLRVLKSGNIELVSYKMKHGECPGLKLTLYIKSNPICIRKISRVFHRVILQPCWSATASKIGEYSSIEEMCMKFKKFFNEKITMP